MFYSKGDFKNTVGRIEKMLELHLNKSVIFENHHINTDKLYIHSLLFTNYTEKECLKAQQLSCCSSKTVHFSKDKQKQLR